jgi:hypothetical protein
MIPDKVQIVRRDGFGGYKTLWWLAVVGELQEVQHVRGFFSEDGLPGLGGDGG